jgi:HTH-type transcriptional regulator / antitoxin HigA
MEANNLKQTDLLEVFGSSGIASEVINGKREISKAHAKKLGERFNIPSSLFLV